MRRCLHAFLIAVLTLAPSMDAARACWHLRSRRQCRPAHVVSHCPPPAWSGCGELVVVREWIVADGCCPPQAACCDGMLVEAVAGSDAAAPADQSRTVVVEAPTPAGGDAVGGVQLEPVPAGPAGEPQPRLGGSDVLPASNDHPVAEAEPADNDVFPPVAAEPEMPEDELTDPLPPTDEQALLPGGAADSEMPEEESLEPPAGDGLDAEPPMEAEAEPAPVADEPVADEPVADEPVADEPAADEPAADAGGEPEPPAPEPEPAEPNLFEEEEADAPAADEEMPEDAAASSPFTGDDTAAGGEGEVPADDGGPLDEVVADDTEEMVEDAADVPAADAVTDEPAPADPFADDPGVPAADEELPMEEEPLPATDEDVTPPPADEEPEPAPLEDAAGGEPSRRWIHATGAHSLVATLVDVVGDGTCVLQTEGRRIRVPLENLSGHDREYVRDAGVRLAALRDQRERAARAAATTAPQATDTAGL